MKDVDLARDAVDGSARRPVTQPLLVARSLSKSFPGVKALDGVKFDVLAGEIHALMGENGAGKSTLIKVLTGVHLKDAGEILFRGASIEPTSPRHAEKLGLSTVYQELSLIPDLSIAENVLLCRQPRRFGLIDHGAIRRRAQDVLARLELQGLDVTEPVHTCSAAVQQMIQIARALAVDAKLLILDEPTSSLDDIEVARLFRVMRRLRDDGLGIVFVTHFLNQVYEVCDRITILRNGQHVGCHAVQELPRLRLIEAMLGRSVDLQKAASGEAPEPTSNRPPLLAARRLERVGVIGPIDFELRAGDVLGLAGLLGSGRSETARMLFGVEPADAGHIEIAQAPTTLSSPKQAIRAGLAFSAEERKVEGIIPNLSVRENIILALQASRGTTRLLSRAEQQRLATHYVEALNIKTPSSETPIRLLSGGNQQKVLLARWLAMQPKVLILDEPTRGVDVGAKAEIEQLISELSTKGVATLLISSELEELSRNCTHVLVLRDRRQVMQIDGAALEPSDIMRVIAGHDGSREPQATRDPEHV